MRYAEHELLYFIQLSKLPDVLLPLRMKAALERGAPYGAGNRLEGNSKPERIYQRKESQKGGIETVL